MEKQIKYLFHKLSKLLFSAKNSFLAIDDEDVALVRGGGQFTVEREFRDIVADGDKGSVKDRVALDAERAKLSMNVLTMLTSLTSMYPALKVTEAEAAG